ncbi:MAG: hypothetical protein NC417_13350 [Candidatus Gastranaerophilales bacterium]|nr:hypothetical protein [Candidatus Gastranaerophilales bacterium]
MGTIDTKTTNLQTNESITFRFGTAPSPGGCNICASTLYNPQIGYGFLPPSHVKLWDDTDCVCGSNVRIEVTDAEGKAGRVTWEYPTFLADVPVGVYQVRLLQTAKDIRTVNGACIQGNLYAVKWFQEGIPASYAEPMEKNWIWTNPGEIRESVCTVAVTDGQLKIELATWLKDNGESGVTCLKELSITRLERAKQPSLRPTLRFVGDSTLAKYPPQDGGTWMPIPERTGWGEDFSMGRFADEELILDNLAVAGSSLKSYRYEGFLNEFFLNCHPGDSVIIESGINDNAPGRRFSTAAEFEAGLKDLIEGCLAFDLQPILCSGTSSALEYVEKIASLAAEYGLPYVDLLHLWETYLADRAPLDLTVDGTHLSRIGGIVAAQLVANEISCLEGYSLSGHIRPLPLTTERPLLRVEQIQTAAQTEHSVTLSWQLDESALYQPQNLITAFLIYRAKSLKETPVLAGSQSTYVSVGMERPQMHVTLDVPENRDYLYYIACQGANGEGPLSEPLSVPAFCPDDLYLLRALCRKLRSTLYPEQAFTTESYGKMKEALICAEKIASRADDSEKETVTKALHTLQSTVSALALKARFLVREDFQAEPPVTAPWGLEGMHNHLASCQIDETGNRVLHLYVEAAGQRFVRKSFPQAKGISADCLTIAFEWYPGKPDRRNCTELEFYCCEGERLLSLKTTGEGHVGFVTGNYDAESTAYLTGDGFHDYEDSHAIDLGLPSEAWYRVEAVFHFTLGTLDLSMTPIPSRQSSCCQIEQTQVSFQGIPLPPCSAHTISSMAFLLMRGKQDNGVTNDLSILWSTEMDNFVMFLPNCCTPDL